MPAVRQTNFLGGEIAPMSWGRNDRPFFGRGARTLRNFFVSRSSGAAVSRPGSLYLGKQREGLSHTSTIRLLPFHYSDGLAYVVEVGVTSPTLNVYFRFWRNDALLTAQYLTVTATSWTVGAVVTGGTSGATATIVSVHSLLGVCRLQLGSITGTFQDAETITEAPGISGPGASGFVSGTIQTATLELLAGTVAANFDARKLRFAQAGASMVLTHPDFSAQELRLHDDVGVEKKWTCSTYSFSPPAPFWDTATYETYPVLGTVIAPTANTPAREWAYLITQTVQDAKTGRTLETTPWRISEQWDGNIANAPVTFSPDSFAVYPTSPVQVHVAAEHLDGTQGALNLANFQTQYRVVERNIYRGRGSLFGFVGTTQAEEFIDVGAEPDYASPPPYGSHPFKVTDQGGLVEYEVPTAVCWFQDRLCFGGTPKRPMGVWASALGDYANFDLPLFVHYAGEPLYFELASRRFEEIRHLVAHQKLVIGTGSSVWTLSGNQAGQLDFDSVEVRMVDETGMGALFPLIVDGFVLYPRTKGQGVRALEYDGQFGVYTPRDISGHAEHLFLGKATGAAGGQVTKELVDWCYAEDPWGLVWAVRNDGALLSLSIGNDGAFGWARHDAEDTTGSEAYGFLPAAYQALAAIPEGDEDYVYVAVKRAVAGGTDTLIERMTSRVRRDEVTDDVCLDSALQKTVYLEGINASLTITGLSHLEGETIYVTGKDNPVQGPYVVTGGEVTLGEDPVANFAGTAHLYVGLLYQCDLGLLDVVTADSRVKQKTVVRVGFELDNAQGIQAGQDFEHLLDSRPHTVESGYDAPVPTTQLLVVTPTRSWDTAGRAVLRQTLPLPVTVVGVVRELEGGN